MLDFDLARIYGYETGYFNRQVKNNVDRFDNDFMFQLTREEWAEILKCKNFTSNWGGNRKLPFAFTEQGLYMLMPVLRGDFAIRQSKTLIRLGRMPLVTKGRDYAVERKKALSFLGFKECKDPLIGHENESFQHYWLAPNKDA